MKKKPIVKLGKKPTKAGASKKKKITLSDVIKMKWQDSHRFNNLWAGMARCYNKSEWSGDLSIFHFLDYLNKINNDQTPRYRRIDVEKRVRKEIEKEREREKRRREKQ